MSLLRDSPSELSVVLRFYNKVYYAMGMHPIYTESKLNVGKILSVRSIFTSTSFHSFLLHSMDGEIQEVICCAFGPFIPKMSFLLHFDLKSLKGN